MVIVSAGKEVPSALQAGHSCVYTYMLASTARLSSGNIRRIASGTEQRIGVPGLGNC